MAMSHYLTTSYYMAMSHYMTIQPHYETNHKGVLGMKQNDTKTAYCNIELMETVLDQFFFVTATFLLLYLSFFDCSFYAYDNVYYIFI